MHVVIDLHTVDSRILAVTGYFVPGGERGCRAVFIKLLEVQLK